MKYYKMIVSFVLCISLSGCINNTAQEQGSTDDALSSQQTADTEDNTAVDGQYYDIYELSDPNSEFNQAIRNNPLDKAYHEEIAIAGTVGEMCQVEQAYIRMWQDELERAATQFVTILSDEDREAFTQVQKQFAAYLDVSFAYDADLVLHHKYGIWLGEISKWLMYRQQRERIREGAIHVKYLHYLLERANGSAATEYTSLQFSAPS